MARSNDQRSDLALREDHSRQKDTLDRLVMSLPTIQDHQRQCRAIGHLKRLLRDEVMRAWVENRRNLLELQVVDQPVQPAELMCPL